MHAARATGRVAEARAAPRRPPRATARRPLAVLLSLPLAVAAGCGTADPVRGDGPVVDMLAPAAPDLGAPDLRSVASGYPPGPYGGNVGDTLQDFVLEGYLRPDATTGLATSAPFSDVHFDQLRTSGARYGLLQLAGFW